jgi:hypothetical protein
MMMMIMRRRRRSVEQFVKKELADETEALGENLPQCHSVHCKSQMTQSGIEPRPLRWETA